MDEGRREGLPGRLASVNRQLGGIYITIPEYHDEQRFPDDLGFYGPMVYMFASPFIGAFKTMAEFREQGWHGALAAIVLVDTNVSTATLPSLYNALQLRPGENCIWLANPAGDIDAGWVAYATQVNARRECERADPGSPPPRLQVYRWSNAALQHSDFPPVARFGESTFLAGKPYGQPLLGIKCLAGWCEIGPSGLTPHTTDWLPMISAGKKGWFDEQVLALPSGPGGRLQPSDIRALIEPVAALELLGRADFPRVDHTNPADLVRGWVHVATVHLSDDPPNTSKYWRWGLRAGQNRLFIRQSTARDVWQASVVPSGSKKRYVWTNLVRYDPHHDVTVPGTARWRWISNDDGTWVRCGQACCSADGGS